MFYGLILEIMEKHEGNVDCFDEVGWSKKQ